MVRPISPFGLNTGFGRPISLALNTGFGRPISLCSIRAFIALSRFAQYGLLSPYFALLNTGSWRLLPVGQYAAFPGLRYAYPGLCSGALSGRSFPLAIYGEGVADRPGVRSALYQGCVLAPFQGALPNSIASRGAWLVYAPAAFLSCR